MQPGEDFGIAFLLPYKQKRKTKHSREVLNMRGYYTANGFRGLVDGKYVLFASEEDYYDSMADEE